MDNYPSRSWDLLSQDIRIINHIPNDDFILLKKQDLSCNNSNHNWLWLFFSDNRFLAIICSSEALKGKIIEI